MSRVDSTRIAAIKARTPACRSPARSSRRTRSSRSATASTSSRTSGAVAVIQPGGSMRDDGSDRGRRRARHRHGLHRHPSLPPLAGRLMRRANLEHPRRRLAAAGSTRWRGRSRRARAWRRCSSRPATAGTARDTALTNVALIDIADLVAFAREHVALTVVGPEAPLAAGIVDAFRAAGLKIFGPTRSRGAARKLQGFRQGVHGAPRHSDGAVAHLCRCARGARLRRRAAVRRS